MNQSPFSIVVPPPVQVNAALAPVHNVLLSLWALTADKAPPVDPALTQVAAQLAPEQRQFNRWLFAVCGDVLLPKASYTDFASYLDALTRQPVEVFHEQRVASAEFVDESTLATPAEALLTDPQALRQQIVDHLRSLWNDLLAAEWKRQTPLLTKMTNSINELVFSQAPWQATDAFTSLRFLLQTEPTSPQLAQVAGVRWIVLVWSPHLLACCSRFGSSDTLWVMRKFDPQLLRRDPLSRAEVLGPLTALSDDARLRILELLIENGEQRAQEIIGQLESSQGNVSRHLKQLVGAGFFRERRAGDANKLYSFNAAGLQRLLYLTRQLLSSDNVQSIGQQLQTETRLNQVRAGASPLLHSLLDESGRITRWSSKLKDQQAMMEYLAGKFEVERSYNEKEVNALLQQWYLDADYVLVRRSMVDAGLLNRTRDGARYWIDAS